MGFQLVTDAFSCLGKKYHHYLNQEQLDPMEILTSKKCIPTLDINIAMKLFMAGKIRNSIREIQLKQQIVTDKMSFESSIEIDFSDQIENLVVAIENLTAVAGTLHNAEGIQREHDSLLEKETIMKSKIVL